MLLRDFTPEELDFLAARMLLRTFGKGDIIIDLSDKIRRLNREIRACQ